MRLMPMTTGYMSSLVVASSGQRYWFQPLDELDDEQRGNRGARQRHQYVLKNRMGPAPSMRAASTSSSGTVRKNCRNKNAWPWPKQSAAPSGPRSC